MANDTRQLDSPPCFHLLAKPSGSTCNIDCKYCFFLSKEALYPNDKQRMSEATLETYIRQLLESHRTPQVTVAWQGGEPTLMKLDFFRRSVELVEKHRKPGQVVQHTFQTNGILLTRAAMWTMAQLFQAGRAPAEVMALTAAEDKKRRRKPCPCGSGLRFCACHGDNAPHSPFSGLTLAMEAPQDGSVPGQSFNYGPPQ
jgi:4Fe-4S single cluster domain/SEC-C motif